VNRGINILSNSLRINPDEILRSFSGDWQNEDDQRKSGRLAAKQIKSCIAQAKSFNRETCFSSSTGAFIRQFERAKSNGFSIHLIYIAIRDVKLAKARIAYRVANGGHGIPNHVVEKRYDKSLKNLKLLLPFFDNVEIYDNSLGEYKTVYVYECGKIWINRLDDFAYLKTYL
jgi:predicted ABC-type ATPase